MSIEGENKHIQKMMDEWRLERCTSLSTPGCDEQKRQEGGDGLGRHECNVNADLRGAASYLGQAWQNPAALGNFVQ